MLDIPTGHLQSLNEGLLPSPMHGYIISAQGERRKVDAYGVAPDFESGVRGGSEQATLEDTFKTGTFLFLFVARKH